MAARQGLGYNRALERQDPAAEGHPPGGRGSWVPKGRHSRGALAMDVLGQVLYGIGGLGALVCFILVVVQMFQRGQTGLGVACIVLLFCCGIGNLVAFVYGWMRHREW